MLETRLVVLYVKLNVHIEHTTGTVREVTPQTGTRTPDPCIGTVKPSMRNDLTALQLSPPPSIRMNFDDDGLAH